MAREALASECDFLMLYSEEPLSSMRQYAAFNGHRDELQRLIRDTQERLNAIVRQERLDLPILAYLPEDDGMPAS